jgi:ankyrin repeat protein
MDELLTASKNGRTEIVKKLLKNGGNVNVQSNTGHTALMIASQFGHKEIVELLLEYGVDVNLRDEKGLTALMFASRFGHTEIVELLLKKEILVELLDIESFTALMIASQNGHKEIVKLLLEYGVNVNLQNIKGHTALMIASFIGHTEIVKLLLEYGGNVNLRDIDGFTAFMLASQNGHIEIVKLLKEKIDDINLQNKSGSTALMLASQNGRKEIVELLLEYGVDVNVQSEKGLTALMLATTFGTDNIIIKQLLNHLLKHGNLNINILNEQNILYCAIILNTNANASYKITEFLINYVTEKFSETEKSSFINNTDKYGFSPFLRAIQAKKYNIAKFLISKNADVNISYEDDFFGDIDALKLIIKNEKDKKDEKEKKEILEIVKAIIKKKPKDIYQLSYSIFFYNNEIIGEIIGEMIRSQKFKYEFTGDNTKIINHLSEYSYTNNEINYIFSDLDLKHQIEIVNAVLENVKTKQSIKKKFKEIHSKLLPDTKREKEEVERKEVERKARVEAEKAERKKVEEERKRKKAEEVEAERKRKEVEAERKRKEAEEAEKAEKVEAERKKAERKKAEEAERKAEIENIKNNRINYIHSKILKFYGHDYDTKNNGYTHYVQAVENIEKQIKIENNSKKDLGTKISKNIADDTKINNKDVNEYNNYVDSIVNLKNDKIKYENERIIIKNDFENSYFYFDPTKSKNRNWIENCKNVKNQCGRLQLRIDIDEPDIDKKIKIHGIFPDENGGESTYIVENKNLFSDEVYYFDEIYNNNFITFFGNISEYNASFDSHLKYSNQSNDNFKYNTIWLAEAIMVLFKTRFSSILEHGIDKIESDINAVFLDPLEFIWGFEKCEKRNQYKNRLYLYFKVCFNTSNNLWQFCKNNYTFSIETGGKYEDGRKKKSVMKSSKKVLRKSVRKSSKKVLRKSVRKVLRKSSKKVLRKSVRKVLRKSTRKLI